MRTIAALIATSLVTGAAAIAAPNIAEARFGAGAIAQAVDIAVAQPTQFSAQRRAQRQQRRAARPRGSGNPVTTIDSTYRDPNSRGALDSCSFC